MQRIFPIEFSTILVRDGICYKEQAIAELGIFSAYLRNKETVISSNQCGYMMRTKVSSSNKGGVAAGFAVDGTTRGLANQVLHNINTGPQVQYVGPENAFAVGTKANEQSNLVEEDLEPTQLMAILEVSEEGKQVKEVVEQKVSLHEEDVGYKEKNIDSQWYLDNGASNHMTEVRKHFKELDEKVRGKVRFGDGSYIKIKGKCSILIECDDEKQRIISHVYYIPSLKSNLLSLGQFTEICCKVVVEDDELRLYDMDNKIFMEVKRQRNRLYKANLRIGTPVCLLANLKDDTWLRHARLEHLNFESLRSMGQRDLVHRIPAIKHTTQICDVCLIVKHSRAPFPKK
nr:zinc finger, CCHC-type [Tanacetum cinerariifolium]